MIIIKDNKVIKIPINYSQRKLNEMGNGYVPCQISDRWLQFSENVTDYRWVDVDVMTLGNDEQPKKYAS